MFESPNLIERFAVTGPVLLAILVAVMAAFWRAR